MVAFEDVFNSFAGATGGEKLGNHEGAAVANFGSPVSDGARSVLAALRCCDDLINLCTKILK